MKVLALTASFSLVLLVSACSNSSSSDPIVNATESTGDTGIINDNGSTNANTQGSGSQTPIADGTDTTGDTGTQTEGSGESGQTAGGSNIVGGNVTAFGGLSASYSAIDDETEWSALFFQSPTAFPVSALEQENILSVSDSCELLDASNPIDPGDGTGGVDPENLPFVPEPVSAGETILITSPAGTYATLTEQSVFGFLIYQTDGDQPIAGPIPSGLTVDIPGAPGGFPAMANVSFPQAAPISFSFDGTTISWTNPSGAGNSSSVSVTMAVIVDSNFASQQLIQCELLDDGTHTVEAGLIPAGDTIEAPLFFGSRSVTQIVQNGSAVLVLDAEADGFLQ